MNKKIIMILLAVVLALGAGFLVSQQTGKNEPSKQNSGTDTSGSETGTTLDLSGQQLTSLPESVLDRTDITTLNLSNNQLATLPSDITRLVNLEVLNVENNRLETFPPEISQLMSLREIHANNNRMTSLPTELYGMTQLKVLDISGNNIPLDQIEQLKAKLIDTEIKT